MSKRNLPLYCSLQCPHNYQLQQPLGHQNQNYKYRKEKKIYRLRSDPSQLLLPTLSLNGLLSILLLLLLLSFSCSLS
ncbi:hypothetical protein SLE2022_393750 [Rubroshorea leprosula]